MTEHVGLVQLDVFGDAQLILVEAVDVLGVGGVIVRPIERLAGATEEIQE